MDYDVILVYPPIMKNFRATDPPFGVMYLGRILKDAGLRVRLLDLNVHRPPQEEVEDFFRKNTAKIVGFSGMTTVYYYIKWLCDVVRRHQPEARLIGGGSFATPCPDVVLKYLPLDVVMVGEGEVSIVELCNALISGGSLEGIPNVAWMKGDEFVQGPARRMENLDDVPFPGYDLVDMDYYVNATAKRPSLLSYCDQRGIPHSDVSNYFIMFSRRGCPFKCSFCYRNYGNKVTVHSVDYVVEHIKYVRKRFNVNNIAFYDETFNANRKWLFDFCRTARKELPDTYFWVGGARADLLDREVIEEMNNSNFYEISIGVESFDDRILEEMGKGVTSEQLFNALSLLKEYGMAPSYMGLLYGFPGDDAKSLRKTIEAAKRLGIPGYFQYPLPFPGTRLYKSLRAKGMLQDEEGFMLQLRDAMTQSLWVNLSRFPDEDLRAMVEKANEEVQNVGR
ncbi:radical SAM superfamily enzyme YgiQ (UPF0313 family) [Desulfomicrobium macestii]|uniref:Radical SAM superfamily enzyme YgiQ (UPF0313 family) n=1 Tax=Desulfomicrobium macestii TaxID=90731 RepID=A0ABR9H6Q8_9BACT|nr:radical SAM protein [Desulfomicrobium macestii]MBE1426398.1 radical SAM superfamily enzyme YgiQ (UPF0313 family) [Desulfomicrobium macestii]